MRTPFALHPFLLAAALACLFSPALRAQDTTPPVVLNPIGNVTVPAGTTQSSVSLKTTFGLSGVTGTVVRFTTVLGNLDVELYDSAAPLNVANFLAYVNAGNYDNTLFQRSVPGFIVQGGGYTIENGSLDAVTSRGTVNGEHTLANTRGTLSLALSTGPNSGSDNWFFNLVDNPMLDDTSDGGPFTVFGHIIENGLTVLDAVAAVPTYDLSASLGADFQTVPLINYNSSQGATVSNLVLISSIKPIKLIVGDPTTKAELLKLGIKGNTNPALVTASIVGRKVQLDYAPGQTGTATITVKARDSAKSKATASFTVTVQ